MVLAAYLIKYEEHNVVDAMKEVISVRSIAFSAEGWKEFVFDVLSAYKQTI